MSDQTTAASSEVGEPVEAAGRGGVISGLWHWITSVLGAIAIHWLPFLLIVVLVLMIAGLVGGALGLPNLFRDDCSLLVDESVRWKSIVNSPLFVTQVFAGLLGAVLWTFILVRGLTAAPVSANLGQWIGAFASRFLVLTLVFLAAGAVNVYCAREAALALGHYPDCYRFQGPLQAAAVRVAVGWAMGFVVGMIYAIFILTVHRLLDTARKAEVNVSLAGWMLWLLGITLLGGIWTYPVLMPAASVIVLMLTVLAIYTFLVSLPQALRFPAFAALLALIVVANSAYDKYRFPGIDRADGTSYYEPAEAGAAASAAATATLIDPIEALEHWKARQVVASAPAATETGAEPTDPAAAAGDAGAVEGGQAPAEPAAAEPPAAPKPKLVLVATSGGAYRAAFWTGLVLDRLLAEEQAAEQPLTGITGAIRAITGASGGMVGAAYFAANTTDSGVQPVDPVVIDEVSFGPTVSRLWRDILEAQEKTPAVKARLMAAQGEDGDETLRSDCFQRETAYPIPGDSLSPVAQQLAQRDFFHLFIPKNFPCERGVILENQWLSLGATYADWRAGEADGWRPSLIMSPMIVEKGQPLLISNLDLKALRGLPGGEEVIEFFNVFPGAEDSFRVKTAVRMNATFPLVSPAVMLPTEPPYRVVDAGYYDNYGVSVAVSFLRVPAVQDWLLDNVSQVILLQLRAFPLVEEPVQASDGAEAEETVPELSVDSAFSFLTAPLTGAGSARKSAMIFRNEQELSLVRTILDERHADRQCPPGSADAAACRADLAAEDGSFLETVVFVNDTDASMNWYLTEKELVADLYDVTQPPSEDAAAEPSEDARKRQQQKQKFADALAKLRSLWTQ